MTPGYDARIERAKYLKTVHPFAAEILTYYSHICTAQKKLLKELERSSKRGATIGACDLREQVDVSAVMPHTEEILGGLMALSPAPLAAFMKEFLSRSEGRRGATLKEYARRGGTDEAAEDSRERLIAAILMQPYAEMLAAKNSGGSVGAAGNLCPRCAARPVAGVLRVEGDGGKRFLLCSFCGSEWEFRRILCAYCGESQEELLPVYVAEKFPHIRIEACDTCRHCLRTVDLTKDGKAIPVVDDLMAIPLALWAEEHGYTRIHDNLLGT